MGCGQQRQAGEDLGHGTADAGGGCQMDLVDDGLKVALFDGFVNTF